MRLFDPSLYEKVHLLIILAFTLNYFVYLNNKRTVASFNRKRSSIFVYLYALIFVIVVGLRPISGAFGDTATYASTYREFSLIPDRIISTRDSLFYQFMWGCSQIMDVKWFFLIVEILYVVPIVIGCKRVFNNNADVALLFCFAAFSFFSYGVNGIRNGVALSLVFLAISFIQGNLFEKVFCLVISLLAVSLHASAALPIVCLIVAYFIKKPRFFFYFWGLSIIVSLVAGNTVAHLFVGLGFDDRLSDYIHPDVEEDLYTKTGFRWDFILYSVMPILLGWYVIFRKRIYNSTYLLLLGTYILANAFWIMVIRAEFSNRFAYLSWFLYPIVLSYPLLKLKIWSKTQGQKTAIIMAAHLTFTLLMVFVVG